MSMNLTLGLNTDLARTELGLFRDEIKKLPADLNQLSNLVVSLNTKSARTEVDELKASLVTAVTGFRDAMNNFQGTLGAAGKGAGKEFGKDIAAGVRDGTNTAINDLKKLGDAAEKEARRASTSISAKLPNGSSVRVSQSMDPNLATSQINTQMSAAAAERQRLLAQNQEVKSYQAAGATVWRQKMLAENQQYQEYVLSARQLQAKAKVDARQLLLAQEQEVKSYQAAGATVWRQKMLAENQQYQEYVLSARQLQAKARAAEKQILLEQAQEVKAYQSAGATAWRQKMLAENQQYQEYVLNGKRLQAQAKALAAASAAPSPSINTNTSGLKAWTAAANDAHSAARGLAGSMGAMWVTWGSTIPLVAFAALGGAMRSIISTGKDVQYQLAFVAALGDGLAVPFQKFADATRGSMSGPKEAAEGMRALAQAGMNTNESLQTLPTVLHLATVGEMSVAEAALSATGAIHAFNLGVEDAGRVGDVFAKAAALSNTSVQGISDSMKQASTVADFYHLSIEDTAASLATMAKFNITGTSAGTAFRNMMRELATPTDKAHAALKGMGLELYDGNNKLKSYDVVMKQLYATVSSMNEKGKLSFLDTVFGERGTKSANAILSDFSQFEKMRDELKGAAGFLADVNAQLQYTVQGKIKQIFNEFQISAAEAFNGASDGLKNFLSEVNNLVKSQGFKDFLEQMAQGLTALASLLMNNGKMIEYFVLSMAGMKIISGVVSGVSALVTAWEAMTIAGAAGTAVLGGVAGLLGSISAILPVMGVAIAAAAAVWVIYNSRLDASSEAHKAFMNHSSDVTDAIDAEAKKLHESNKELAERNRLMSLGLNPDDAKANLAAQSRLTGIQRMRDEVAQLEQEQANAKQAQENAAKNGGHISRKDFGDAGRSVRIAELKQRIQAESGTLEKEGRSAQAASTDKLIAAAGSERNKILAQLMKQDEQVKAGSNKNKKLNNIPTWTKDQFADTDELKKLAQEREDFLNKNGLDAPAKIDKAAQKAADSAAQGEIKIFNAKVRTQDSLYSAKEAIEKARQSAGLTSEAEYSYKLGQIEEEHYQARLRLEVTGQQALLEMRNKRGVSDSEKEKIDAELKVREENVTKLIQERDLKKEVAEIDVQGAIKKIRDSANKSANSADASVQDMIRAMWEKTDTSTLTEREAAMWDARRKAETQYSTAIANTVTQLQELRATLDGMAEGPQKDGVVKQLNQSEKALELLKGRQSSAGTFAGEQAGANYDVSSNWAKGAEAAWTQYRESATNNAKLVGTAMANSFQIAEDAFVKFTTTGKWNFKEFASSIMKELAAMAAKKALMQILQYVVNLAGSSGGNTGTYSGGMGPGSASYAAATMPASMQHGGGIAGGVAFSSRLTDSSNFIGAPRFHTGGIAGDEVPIIAKRGEGIFTPEQMHNMAPAGGGGKTEVSIVINNNGANTTAQTDTKGDNSVALGRMVESAVMGVIAREKSPGGQLYTGRRNG